MCTLSKNCNYYGEDTKKTINNAVEIINFVRTHASFSRFRAKSSSIEPGLKRAKQLSLAMLFAMRVQYKSASAIRRDVTAHINAKEKRETDSFKQSFKLVNTTNNIYIYVCLYIHMYDKFV